MSDPLFRSIYIGPVELKNRIFMPAMHLNMCKNFMVTEQLIEFYRERAKGGVGLISVGYATVDELSGSPAISVPILMSTCRDLRPCGGNS